MHGETVINVSKNVINFVENLNFVTEICIIERLNSIKGHHLVNWRHHLISLCGFVSLLTPTSIDSTDRWPCCRALDPDCRRHGQEQTCCKTSKWQIMSGNCFKLRSLAFHLFRRGTWKHRTSSPFRSCARVWYWRCRRNGRLKDAMHWQSERPNGTNG